MFPGAGRASGGAMISAANAAEARRLVMAPGGGDDPRSSGPAQQVQVSSSSSSSLGPNEVVQISARCIDDALLRDDTVPLTVDDIYAPGTDMYERQQEGYDFRGLSEPPRSWEQPNSAFALSGYFNELECGWKSMGPVLHLWHGTASAREYVGVEQDILAAEVVRAKSFLPDVDFLLVLATISEVSLHAISACKPGCAVQINKTKYTITTDEVKMIRLAGDPRSRRIFMGGEDGGIYEFRYTRDDDRGMFRNRATAQKQTLRKAGYLPSFLSNLFTTQTPGEHAVEQLAVDAQRELLYALRKDVILVFDIGPGSSKESREETTRCHFLFEFYIKDVLANLRRLNLPSMLNPNKPMPGCIFIDPKKQFDAAKQLPMLDSGLGRELLSSNLASVGGEAASASSNLLFARGVSQAERAVADERSWNDDEARTQIANAMTGMKVPNSIVKIFPMNRVAGWETQLAPNAVNSVRQQIAGLGSATRTSMQYEAAEYVLQAICRDGTRIFFKGRFAVKLAFSSRLHDASCSSSRTAQSQRLNVAHGAGLPNLDAAVHHLVEEARRAGGIGVTLRHINIGHGHIPPVKVFEEPNGTFLPYLVNDAYSFSGVTLLCVRPAVRRNLDKIQVALRAREDALPADVFGGEQAMAADGGGRAPASPAMGMNGKAARNGEHASTAQVENGRGPSSSTGRARGEVAPPSQNITGLGLGSPAEDMHMGAPASSSFPAASPAVTSKTFQVDQSLIDEDDELCCTKIVAISTDIRPIAQRMGSRTPWHLRGLPSERYDVIPLHRRGFATEVFCIGESPMGCKLDDAAYTGDAAKIMATKPQEGPPASSSSFASAFFKIGEKLMGDVGPAESDSMSAVAGGGTTAGLGMGGTHFGPIASASGRALLSSGGVITGTSGSSSSTSNPADGNSGGLRLRATWRKNESPFLQYSQLSELCTEQALETRKFYVLSTEGLMEFARRRPAEEFLRTLVEWDPINSPLEQGIDAARANPVMRFFDSYTSEEAMAMCFQIAAGAANLSSRGHGANAIGGPKQLVDLGAFPGVVPHMLANHGANNPQDSSSAAAISVPSIAALGEQVPDQQHARASGGSQNFQSFASIRKQLLPGLMPGDAPGAGAGASSENYSTTAGMRGFSALPYKKPKMQFGTPTMMDASGRFDRNDDVSKVSQPMSPLRNMNKSFMAQSINDSLLSAGTKAATGARFDVLTTSSGPSSDPAAGNYQLALLPENTAAMNTIPQQHAVVQQVGYQPGLAAAVSVAEYLLFVTEAALKVGGLVVLDNVVNQHLLALPAPSGGGVHVQAQPQPHPPGAPSSAGKNGSSQNQQVMGSRTGQNPLGSAPTPSASSTGPGRNQQQIGTPASAAQVIPTGGPNFVSEYGYAVRQGSEQRLAETCRSRGLALYLSRLLRPFWGMKILQLEKTPVLAQGGRKRGRDDSFLQTGYQPTIQFSTYSLTWRRGEREWLNSGLRGLLGVLRKAQKYNLQYFGGEAQLFQGMLTIVERSLDVLQFLHMLAQRLLSENGHYDLAQLAGLPFRDFVTGDNGRTAVLNLVRGTKLLDCVKVAQKCPHLISIAEAEVQHAHEVLELPGTNVEVAIQLLRKNVELVDMQETGARLRARGCIYPLIELSAMKARSLDPLDGASEAPLQNQSVHMMRMNIYEPIYQSLNDLAIRAQQRITIGRAKPVEMLSRGDLTRSHQHSIPLVIPGDLNSGQAAEMLERLVHVMLEVKDRLLQCGLFKLLLKWGVPIWELRSPYLHDFLASRKHSQPTLLCKYYQANGLWAEACEEYRSVARIPWPAAATAEQEMSSSAPAAPNSSQNNMHQQGPGGVLQQEQPSYTLDERLNLLETANLLSNKFADKKASILFLIRQVRCQMTAQAELEDQNANAGIVREVQASILDVPVLRAIADKYRLFTTQIAVCFWHDDTRHLRHYVDRWLRQAFEGSSPDQAKDLVVRLLLAYLRPFSAFVPHQNDGSLSMSAALLPSGAAGVRDPLLGGASGGQPLDASKASNPSLTQMFTSTSQQHHLQFLPLDLIALRLFEYPRGSPFFSVAVLREAGLSWSETYQAFHHSPIPKSSPLYETKHFILLGWQEELALRGGGNYNIRGVSEEVALLRRYFQELALELRQLGPAQISDHVVRQINHLALRIDQFSYPGGGML